MCEGNRSLLPKSTAINFCAVFLSRSAGDAGSVDCFTVLGSILVRLRVVKGSECNSQGPLAEYATRELDEESCFDPDPPSPFSQRVRESRRCSILDGRGRI